MVPFSRRNVGNWSFDKIWIPLQKRTNEMNKIADNEPAWNYSRRLWAHIDIQSALMDDLADAIGHVQLISYRKCDNNFSQSFHHLFGRSQCLFLMSVRCPRCNHNVQKIQKLFIVGDVFFGYCIYILVANGWCGSTPFFRWTRCHWWCWCYRWRLCWCCCATRCWGCWWHWYWSEHIRGLVVFQKKIVQIAENVIAVVTSLWLFCGSRLSVIAFSGIALITKIVATTNVRNSFTTKKEKNYGSRNTHTTYDTSQSTYLRTVDCKKERDDNNSKSAAFNVFSFAEPVVLLAACIFFFS